MDIGVPETFCETVGDLCSREEHPDCEPNKPGSLFFIGTEYTALVTPCGIERVMKDLERYVFISKDYWRVQKGLDKAGMLKYWIETKNFEGITYKNRNNVYRVRFLIPPHQDKAELSVIFVTNKYMKWDYYGPIPIFKGKYEFLIGEPFDFVMPLGKAKINEEKINSKRKKERPFAIGRTILPKQK